MCLCIAKRLRSNKRRRENKGEKKGKKRERENKKMILIYFEWKQ